MNGIGKTGLLVAAIRAQESERADKLFSDPFAKNLAGEEGFDILAKAVAAVGEQPAIAIRTRYFDDRINFAIKDGIKQFVILAAGMDSRAYRLNFASDTKVFEIDRPEVLHYKNEKLGSAKAKCERIALEMDLQDDWEKSLIKAGMNPGARTLWLVEGLTVYLDEKTVRAIFKKISDLSKTKSVLLFDMIGSTLLKAPFMVKQLEFLTNMDAPWLYGNDEPEALMSEYGWTAKAVQTGEVVPERWPMPVTPRNVPNVPRGFFLEAIKN